MSAAVKLPFIFSDCHYYPPCGNAAYTIIAWAISCAKVTLLVTYRRQFLSQLTSVWPHIDTLPIEQSNGCGLSRSLFFDRSDCCCVRGRRVLSVVAETLVCGPGTVDNSLLKGHGAEIFMKGPTASCCRALKTWTRNDTFEEIWCRSTNHELDFLTPHPRFRFSMQDCTFRNKNCWYKNKFFKLMNS